MNWQSMDVVPSEGERVIWYGESKNLPVGVSGRFEGFATFRGGEFREDEFGDDLQTTREVRILGWAPFPQYPVDMEARILNGIGEMARIAPEKMNRRSEDIRAALFKVIDEAKANSD